MRLTYEAVLLPTGSGRDVRRAGDRADSLGAAAGGAPRPGVGCRRGERGRDGRGARVLAALPVTAREMLWQNAFEVPLSGGLLAALSATDRPRATRPPHPGGRLHRHPLGGPAPAPGNHRRLPDLRVRRFFAVAIRFTDLLGGESCDLCPVLIEPSHDISETPAPDAESAAARRLAGVTGWPVRIGLPRRERGLAAPFTLAEAAGWAAAPLAAAKTLTPAAAGKLRHRLRDLAAPAAPTELTVDNPRWRSGHCSPRWP